MKLLLVYPPFCTPTIMPYSVSNLKGFVAANTNIEVKALDLNAKFHRLRFPESYSAIAKKLPDKEYLEVLEEFDKSSRPIYAENNRRTLSGENPDLFEEMLGFILKENPDLVAFSLVYNSQCFYAKSLLDELAKRKIPCILGGPADTSILSKDHTLVPDEHELLDYLAKHHNIKAPEHFKPSIPTFSDFEREDYLTRELIIPIKASTGCCYGQCTFCTHHGSRAYTEVPLELLKKTVEQNNAKHLFFIDDLIHTKRLLEIAKLLKPMNVNWTAELRPTAELLGKFGELHDSGLNVISWGLESASPAVLKAIRKGTNPTDIAKVLKESHTAGITNILFVMFGFPGETKEDFIMTIDFLKANKEYIGLVSTAIFGLQKGSYVYSHPEEFGIESISLDSRTVLGESISYTLKNGLQREEARRLRSRYVKTIKSFEKLPRVLNYFKEQALLVGKP